MTSLSDALIVGAGPTGLSLAAQLDAFGASVRIVDRQPDRTHESRALAVQPRTLELLRGTGLADKLIERGCRGVKLHMHFPRRLLRVPLFDVGVEDTSYPFLLIISQAETETILNQHLVARGIPVERRLELMSFEQAEDAVECTLQRENGAIERVRTRYLVGCDGARSTVRHLAGIPFEGDAYPQTFVLADLDVDGALERNTVHAFLGTPGMLFFFPLERPATWRLIGMQPGCLGEARLSLEHLQAISDAFTGGELRLQDPVWLTRFRLHRRLAARYREGRVFLAGDAAHVHSPAGAQGMNTGIQDAWNLGWKLALVIRGIAHETLLDSYEAERRPVGRFVLRFSDRAFTIATSSGPAVRLLRTQLAPRLAPLFLRLRPLRAKGFRTIAQLTIHYRHSPAVEEGRPPLQRGPAAGDRLPDAPVARDGTRCRLQDAISTPGYHLLLCGPADAWNHHQLAAVRERYTGLLTEHRLTPEAAPGVLHDVDGQALARLGAPGTAQYLVRPDGHIGFRCDGTDLRDLEHHLARWLPTPRGWWPRRPGT